MGGSPCTLIDVYQTPAWQNAKGKHAQCDPFCFKLQESLCCGCVNVVVLNLLKCDIILTHQPKTHYSLTPHSYTGGGILPR